MNHAVTTFKVVKFLYFLSKHTHRHGRSDFKGTLAKKAMPLSPRGRRDEPSSNHLEKDNAIVLPSVNFCKLSRRKKSKLSKLIICFPSVYSRVVGVSAQLAATMNVHGCSWWPDTWDRNTVIFFFWQSIPWYIYSRELYMLEIHELTTAITK